MDCRVFVVQSCLLLLKHNNSVSKTMLKIFLITSEHVEYQIILSLDGIGEHMFFLKKILVRSSVCKNTCCVLRGPWVQAPVSTLWSANIYNSSSRGSEIWSPQAPRDAHGKHTYIISTYIHTGKTCNMHTHKKYLKIVSYFLTIN